jgi:hypothetical protein
MNVQEVAGLPFPLGTWRCVFSSLALAPDIETPSESYNRIMSCLIGHVNPATGACYPRHSLIAIETGYSRDTIKRAIRWWAEQGFLTTEGRGIGKALAYHPNWKLFKAHSLAVARKIAAGKEKLSHGASRCTTRSASTCTTAMVHHGALHNLKAITSKNESKHEMAHPPSAADAAQKEVRKKGFQEKKIQRKQLSKRSEGISQTRSW